MTNLRRYVFALLAVCVAFAAGIALGNGPLQGGSTTHDSVSLSDANARLSGEVSALKADQAFSQALGKAAGPALLKGQLTNTSIAIFVLPGVPKTTVSRVGVAVAAAGGQLVLTAHLSAELVDPAKKTYVDSVATNAARGLKDLASVSSESAYGRIGALIARAYTGSSAALAVDDEASHLDAQLQGAKIVALSDPLTRRASAVIVLGPADHGAAEAVYAGHQIEMQVVNALAGRADGTLLAGPISSSEPGGLIRTVNSSKAMTNAVATLNVVDTAAGQTVAVGALAAAIDGQPGAFGMNGSDAVLPPAFTTAG